LSEVWNEEVEAMDLGFTIDYTEEAIEMMDDRMILKTDVIRVLQNLKETSEAILDGETNLCVTRARLGNVTFWVKYTETETGFLVHRAYSHRMKVMTR
jgi:hypothetical protein